MSNAILQDKVFKVSIKGDIWNVYKVDQNDNDMVDEESLAETVFGTKELFFKDTSLRIVRHELIHVFLGYTYVDAADLKPSQQEEIFAEMMSYEMDNYLNVANDIYEGLVKLGEE